MSFNQRRGQQQQQFGNMPLWSPSSALFGIHPLDVLSNFMLPMQMPNIIDPFLSQLMRRNLRWIEPVPQTRRQQQQKQQFKPKVIKPKAKQQQQGKMVQQQQQQRKQVTRPVTTTRPRKTTVPSLGSGVRMPQKYRIHIGCTGISPSALKTKVKCVGDQAHLIVSGQERRGKEGVTREFKRSFTLPTNVQCKNMCKFVTPAGGFVVEIPFQDTITSLDIDLSTKICKVPEGRIVMVRVPIPDFVDPAKVQLSLKGRELIVRFEERLAQCGDCVSRVFFYNRVTLPENTNLNQLSAKSDKHRLIITAPVRCGTKTISTGLRTIPIQRKLRQRKGVKAVEPQREISGGVEKKKKQQPVTPKKKQQGEKKKNVVPTTVGGEKKKTISPKASGTKLSELGRISSQQRIAGQQESQVGKKEKESSSTKKKSTTKKEGSVEKGSDILKKVFGTERGTTGSESTQQRSGQREVSDVISGGL